MAPHGMDMKGDQTGKAAGDKISNGETAALCTTYVQMSLVPGSLDGVRWIRAEGVHVLLAGERDRAVEEPCAERPSTAAGLLLRTGRRIHPARRPQGHTPEGCAPLVTHRKARLSVMRDLPVT